MGLEGGVSLSVPPGMGDFVLLVLVVFVPLVLKLVFTSFGVPEAI